MAVDAARLDAAFEAAPVRPRPRSSRGLAGGVAWIVVVALLLAGVVALNVAVLRLNLRMDALTRERAELIADNAVLQSQLSSAAAAPRIQKYARRHGQVPAEPESTVYVSLAPHRHGP